MTSQTIIVSILLASVLAVGCASPDPRRGSNENGYGPERANKSYYAVIESIECRWPAGDSDPIGSTTAYRIRIRFDDKSYRTVTQSSVDGLRIGDSVRIERGRVRHYWAGFPRRTAGRVAVDGDSTAVDNVAERADPQREPR